MKLSLAFKAFTVVAGLTLTGISANAQSTSLLENYNLGGNQVNLVETDLSINRGKVSNPENPSGPLINGPTSWVNASGVYTAASTSGTGTIVASNGGYPATAGLYKWMGAGNYNLDVTNDLGAGYGAKSVIFQYQFGKNPDFDVTAPTLSFNGGSQALNFLAGGWTQGPVLVTGTPVGDVDFFVYAWQWDLSGIAESIDSITINATPTIHESVVGLSLQVSDSVHSEVIVEVIPEPSTYALIAFGVGGLLLMRRRQSSMA